MPGHGQAAWCLPGGSESLRARPRRRRGDARPLALAAPAGVRHLDGRRTTAGGLPSAREQVPSHAHAAWRPFCATRGRPLRLARSLPETPRSTAEEHPAPARSMAWPLPLSWKGREGPRAAPSTGLQSRWQHRKWLRATFHRLAIYVQGLFDCVHFCRSVREEHNRTTQPNGHA